MLSPLKIMNSRHRMEIRQLYDTFDAPIAALDCGARCAPHHPDEVPFCCDICHAVPTATRSEWDYLRRSTDLWHVWRGDECPDDSDDLDVVRAETPDYLHLLACKGVASCSRGCWAWIFTYCGRGWLMAARGRREAAESPKKTRGAIFRADHIV